MKYLLFTALLILTVSLNSYAEITLADGTICRYGVDANGNCVAPPPPQPEMGNCKCSYSNGITKLCNTVRTSCPLSYYPHSNIVYCNQYNQNTNTCYYNTTIKVITPAQVCTKPEDYFFNHRTSREACNLQNGLQVKKTGVFFDSMWCHTMGCKQIQYFPGNCKEGTLVMTQKCDFEPDLTPGKSE